MTDDTRANAAQAVPRTLTTDEWRQLRELVDDRPYALHLVNRAEAASLVPAPDLDGLIAAINALPNPWSPEVSPDDFDPEAFVDRNAVLAILRAAASPTAHSAPPSEALREAHPFTYGGPLSTTCGWRDPATGRQCLQARASRTHRLASSDRDASPATPDARHPEPSNFDDIRRNAELEALWTDPAPETNEGQRLWRLFREGRLGTSPSGIRDFGQRVCQIEAESATPGPNRDPLGIWRGKCGHVWDRRDEDTEACPRCAATPDARQEDTN